VILIAIILAVLPSKSPSPNATPATADIGGRPDDGHTEEVQEGQEHLETSYKKPELEAAPVIDPTIRGPVKKKFELQDQETIKAEAISDLRVTDTVEAPNTNQLGSHEPGGYIPSELDTNPILEAGTGTLTEQQIK
jgi:hypothetical protein